MVNRREIKLSARSSLNRQKKTAAAVTLLFLVLTFVLGVLANKVINAYEISNIYSEHAMAYMEGAESYAEYVKAINSIKMPTTYAMILYFAILIVSSVLNAGYAGYALNVSRDKQVGISSLFDSFYIFFKVFWLNLVKGFFIGLWSMLLIVPGIIAAIRYSQAMYILLDDPKKPVMQCIRESKYMMAGSMGQYVKLCLNFIGWYILFYLESDAVSTLINAAMGYIELSTQWLVIYAVLAIGLTIIYVIQYPYTSITYANFYRRLIGERDGDIPHQEPERGPQNPWKS